MINRAARDCLALALRRLAAGRITNDEFDDEVSEWWGCTDDDPALGELAVYGWLHYSDLREYRLRGRDKLSQQARRSIARAILFLKSDQEYVHGDAIIANTILSRRSLGCVLAVFGSAIITAVIVYASSGSFPAAFFGFLTPLIFAYLSWMLVYFAWGAINRRLRDRQYRPLPHTFWPFLDSKSEAEAFRFWPLPMTNATRRRSPIRRSCVGAETGRCEMVRDPVENELPYRPDLTAEQIADLVEWAVRKKYKGQVRTRGTDPAYPGSIFWKLVGDVRITLWPKQQRLWATHSRTPDDDVARIVRYVAEVVATHPPTRH